ncbi:glycosyltransferase family 87 protein [Arthrobacter caoxuetaonis]|uniref:Glycosyltransferase 87 family protein n=1 Tax=Arthrobacter caoxuetaonis TaxID=2886935 RepID=A0A9X1MH87_9MICC|nr:glycosyltransferase 87 family protein [Arthrobacter caoxuetaonis]MCC3298534.1 glycosyltransferase 87 family protein [Arthrobacter caoxuetaonis]USQ57280.1 glycosyltransferase 87 family protein [Arthrobacter caoxuetaonis]
MDSSPRRRPMRIVVPSRNDRLLRRFTEVIGGPLGRFTAPGIVSPGFFTVERVLIFMTTGAALLALLAKTPCRLNGWSDQFYQACYSDWPALFSARGLGDGIYPFISSGSEFEYPVLLGLLAGFVAWLVPAGAESRGLVYFDLNAVLATAAWIVTVVATMRMANRRPWDAAMVAVAPALILSVYINWDMWAVMLAALGMLAFARNRPVAAGIFFGLGTALKLYPVLILGAILVLALRTLKLRPALLTFGATAGTWLVVNIPFMVRDYAGWKYFYDFSAERGSGNSSVWQAWDITFPEQAVDAEFISFWALFLFAAACAGIAVLGLAAPRRPRLAQLAFLIVAAFILTNKVYSPQFVLWLVPLLALARPRWRDFLVWQFFEVMHWWAIWLYLAAVIGGGPAENNLDGGWFVLSVLGHMLATMYLMGRVVMDILDPRTDPVRRMSIDDPQGGPFDHAPDRWRLRLRRQQVPLETDAAPAKEAL